LIGRILGRENFDGLDFMDDGDQGAVELSLLEEEQEQQNKKGSNRNSSGCSVILFLIGSLITLAGWYVIQRV
jgi:hypothetical protein